MKYKCILKFTAGLCLAMFLAPLSSAGQEIGLQLYSLREQFKGDVEGTLKLIHEWGITAIEGGGTYGMSQQDFQALLDKYNLEVRSVGASYEDLNNVEAIIENARDFGAKSSFARWPQIVSIFTGSSSTISIVALALSILLYALPSTPDDDMAGIVRSAVICTPGVVNFSGRVCAVAGNYNNLGQRANH